MTPEEEAALEQYILQMQSNPLARATNDYGQGAGFLQLDKQPESWDRMGEKNDLFSDFFRTTQTYLPDWIPDLYPEVEDPGRFDGFRSDQADLYRNNPAYSQLEAAMAEGASFDEAIQLIAKAPQFAAGLPKTERGDVDLSAFRNSAETYVSERAREGREFDAYDAERQAYEDYVNPQTAWSMDRTDRQTDDISQFLRPIAADSGRPVIPMELPSARRGSSPGAPGAGAAGFVDRVGNSIEGIFDPNKPGPGMPSMPSVRDIEGIFDPNKRGPKKTTGRLGNMNPEEAEPGVFRKFLAESNKNVNDIAAKKAKYKKDVDTGYNKALTEGYNRMRGAKEAQVRPSKKQENLAKIAAYYNALHYGE